MSNSDITDLMQIAGFFLAAYVAWRIYKALKRVPPGQRTDTVARAAGSTVGAVARHVDSARAAFRDGRQKPSSHSKAEK